ncbi:hypothetical protein CASFOL_004735 [Castilleja foliolosa]|uniref:RNA helicase aquarius N-terminal domain-containing protein n=1 Tax=Castilleja foliolosa TaxID=1961234 RepID=A0ABD3EBB6_9LAMI
MRLASLECWHSLSYGRFQYGTDVAKHGEAFGPTTVLEANFLRNLIEEFLKVLDSEVLSSKPETVEDSDRVDVHGTEVVDGACLLYCERFMEFLIDLLSQLPTRRLIRPLVAAVAVVSKCHLSDLCRHDKGKLFAQLVETCFSTMNVLIIKVDK